MPVFGLAPRRCLAQQGPPGGGLRRRPFGIDDQMGLWQFVVIESADVQDRQLLIDRWRGVGRVEGPVFSRVLIGAHGDAQHPFYIGNRPINIQDHPVRMPRGDRKAVRPGVVDDRLVVLLCRAELLGELRRREIFPVIGAGGIAQLREQLRERLLIAQRETDCQAQVPHGIQATKGLQMGGGEAGGIRQLAHTGGRRLAGDENAK